MALSVIQEYIALAMRILNESERAGGPKTNKDAQSSRSSLHSLA